MPQTANNIKYLNSLLLLPLLLLFIKVCLYYYYDTDFMTGSTSVASTYATTTPGTRSMYNFLYYQFNFKAIFQSLQFLK